MHVQGRHFLVDDNKEQPMDGFARAGLIKLRFSVLFDIFLSFNIRFGRMWFTGFSVFDETCTDKMEIHNPN